MLSSSEPIYLRMYIFPLLQSSTMQAAHYKVYAGQTAIGLRLLGLDYRTLLISA